MARYSMPVAVYSAIKASAYSPVWGPRGHEVQ
jgi:hypothetical protein